ncbi:hypothetical protein N7471_004703 [Penicillium samsonianum]|uniref:uncharacterized protein n=1 Tax=Penicillium samsonianum TaxID=1882272 RepID=UPI0025475BA7|nr:uncharacterized protein N7471_004703 [Penicillium samsonianum]KAJ6138217.1 hypothetical protein N7471_004703 [Penicillium samsonianum]
MPRFIEQGQGGSVINISSTGAGRPRPGLVWYNATKGAVTNATEVSSQSSVPTVSDSTLLLLFFLVLKASSWIRV